METKKSIESETMQDLFTRLCLILFLVIFAMPVVGQSDNDDDEARQIVLEAFAALGDGYRFTMQSIQIDRATDAYGDLAGFGELRVEDTVEGRVSANGDQSVDFLRVASSDQVSEYTAHNFTRLVCGEDIFINIHEIAGPPPLLSLARGWWRYDDLVNQLGGFRGLNTADIFLDSVVPSELLFDAELIQSVTESESELLGDVPMRVFDIEMNALMVASIRVSRNQAQLLTEDGITPQQALGQRVGSLAFWAVIASVSEFELRYRFWIGPEDGMVYRMEATGRTWLPFLDANLLESSVNEETEYTTVIEFSGHGAEFDITPPDQSELNG